MNEGYRSTTQLFARHTTSYVGQCRSHDRTVTAGAVEPGRVWALRSRVGLVEDSNGGVVERGIGLPTDMRAVFAAGGEAGARMLSIDWEATPLGPVEAWPQSLRTAVSIVLSSMHPLLIWWGPELLMLYNDALAPSFGDKHPEAVSRPGQEMFAEMWDVIGPMLHGVLDSGVATWRYDEPLPMNRHGFLEDTYWTYSYSPILDEAGAVAGVFTATSETTERVLRERRLGILQEQARATEGARSTEQACQATVRSLEQHQTDLPFVAIYLVDELGIARLAARTAAGPADLPQVASDSPAGGWPVLDVVEARRLTVLDLDDGHRAVLTPVISPGEVAPAAVLVAGIGPTVHFDGDYERFFTDIAVRLANAIADVSAYSFQRLRADALSELQRARVEAASRERLIADELQRSLLPTDLGSPPGLQVAVHYRAGVEGTQVGGDWYDVIPLGGARTGLVIGDVMGRGVQAAAVMGQLRTAIRAYAQLDLGPARVLSLLDRLVEGMPDDHIVTCVYAVYDDTAQSLTYANAGHPPPILVLDGQNTLLEEQTTAPLGTGEVDVTDSTVTVGAGALLALYTDGLVESRTADIDTGIANLQALLDTASHPTADLISQPYRIAESLRPGGIAEDDDIALLLVRVGHGGTSGGLVERDLELAAEHQSAGAARRFVRGILDEVGRPDWRDDGLLAVSELVTNALLHAHTAVRLSVTASAATLRVAVRDLSPALPTRRSYDDQATTGRGMALVEALASSVGVEEHGDLGKTVWFTLGEPGPAVTGHLPEVEHSTLVTTRAVVLRNLPATLWLAARQHHDALLRELALAHPTANAGAQLAAADSARRTISLELDRVIVLASERGQTRAPLPADHPGTLPEVPAVVNLQLHVPAAAAADFAALQDALDQAERLAAAGLTLARPGLPEIVAVRDWACEQVIAQLAGAPASPWSGTATERFHARDHETPVLDPEATGLATRWGVAADDANRILAISDGLAQFLGWQAEALVGRRVVALVPPRYREAHVAGFTRHLTTGEAHAIGTDLELPVLRADGSEVACTFLIEMHTIGSRTVYIAWISPPHHDG